MSTQLTETYNLVYDVSCMYEFILRMRSIRSISRYMRLHTIARNMQIFMVFYNVYFFCFFFFNLDNPSIFCDNKNVIGGD
jgi:hypothetical protein